MNIHAFLNNRLKVIRNCNILTVGKYCTSRSQCLFDARDGSNDSVAQHNSWALNVVLQTHLYKEPKEMMVKLLLHVEAHTSCVG